MGLKNLSHKLPYPMHAFLIGENCPSLDTLENNLGIQQSWIMLQLKIVLQICFY